MVHRFRSRKIAALLAYLAHFRDRRHPREVLIELFWPESEPEAGRQNLSQALSSLRHQLEPPGVPSGAVIVADRHSVGVNPTTVSTDVAEFEAALREAGPARGLAERDLLARAVEFYRGTLLPGYYEEWIPAEQERLGDLYFDAAHRLVGLLEGDGEFARALDVARRAVGIDPLREDAQRHLIRLLASAGQPAAALRQFRALERLLDEELGTAPSSATRALAQRLESHGERTDEGTPEQTGDEGGPESSSTRPRVPSPTPSLPRGTVTLLLAGIDGATSKPERPAEAEPGAANQRRTLRDAIREHGGHVVTEADDSCVTAFERASDAVAAAVSAMRRVSIADCGLRIADCPDPTEGTSGLRRGSTNPQSAIRNPQWRMALHSGDVELEGDRYGGLTLDRATRLLAAAHGGQILCSEATAGLLRRDLEPGLRLLDLGLYRLHARSADLPEPERLFQIAHPGMVAAREGATFPPPAAERAYPSNLPPQFTRFIGRESELERLGEVLCPECSGFGVQGAGRTARANSASSSSSLPPPTAWAPAWAPASSSSILGPRLVTLTGSGGTGKTRLALEAARRLLGTFAGAVWYVPLEDIESPAAIGGAMADALRLPREPGTDPFNQAAAMLGQQPSLVVLDNFEQLIEQRAKGNGVRAAIREGPERDGAGVVRELLARAPSLTCVVTSRQMLGLEGEREFAVPPMPTPGGADSPERLTLYESVQLFIDRAQAVRPDFQVTKQNAAAVAELCDGLEGLPLAIELAAARAQVLTPAQMLAQLTDRFGFLVSRRRDTAARHRTLRAAVEWSYHLLPPDLRRFFAALSVFRGGWTLEAAEAVCGCLGVWVDGCPEGEPATPTHPSIHTPILPLDALAQLRECSLIVADDGGGEMRYRMLETLREFAAGQLAPEEVAELRRRHGEHFTALAERLEPELTGPEQLAALNRLDAEHANLRAAAECSVAGSRLSVQTALQPATDNWRAATAMRLAVALWRFWWLRGYAAEGRRALEAALARAPAEDPELGRGALRARALDSAGALAHEQADYPAATGYLKEALALWRALENAAGQASALNNLANVAYDQGEYDRAAALYEAALALYREAGDARGTAMALTNLGGLEDDRGQHDRAAALLAESLTLKQSLGNRYGVGISLDNLGNVERHRGDHTRAAELYEEALALRRELGHKVGIAQSLANLGAAHLALGDRAAARRSLREGLDFFRQLEDRRGILNCLAGLTGVAAASGEAGRAARLAGAVAALRTAQGIVVPPPAQAAEAAALAPARATLGERRFAAAESAGRTLSLEQAIGLGVG